MNQKYLSIFQKYRGRQFDRDLEELRKNLSYRGLLNSGIENGEIKILTENYRDEIEMKKEEIIAEIEEQKKQKTDRLSSRIINIILVIIAIFGTLLSVWTFSETQKLNRPYLSMVERNNVLKGNVNNDPLRQILKVTIKNTGTIPAQFNTSIEGWYCTSTPRRSDSDYIAPNQEIEIGYDLFNGCKLSTDNLCKILEDIKIIIKYKSPNQKHFEYLTSFKMKNIPGTKDMANLKSLNSTSSFYQYDVVFYRCEGSDERNDIVSVWYVEQMK